MIVNIKCVCYANSMYKGYVTYATLVVLIKNGAFSYWNLARIAVEALFLPLYNRKMLW